MSSALKSAPDNFLKIIAASFILHVVIIAFGLLIYKGDHRTYLTPVTVSLVGPEALGGRNTPVAAPSALPVAGTAPKQAAQKQAVTHPAKPVTAQKTQVQKRSKNPFALKKKEKDDSAEDAIRHLKEKVKKKIEKEELSSTESHIDALKKKTAAGVKTKSAKRQGQENGLKSSGALEAFSKTDTTKKTGQKAGSGTGADSPSVKYRAYLTAIGDRVKQNWTYPEEIRKDRIEVIVSIRIGRNGKLLESWVEKSSGNSLFDESLMDAIKKSAPYPEVPADYDGNVFETGLRFCRNCGQ